MSMVEIKGKYLSLFTTEQIRQLSKNGIDHADDHDAIPCVYLLGKSTSYLISEICPEETNLGYGIYIDNNIPMLGFIDLEKLEDAHKHEEYLFNFKSFEAKYPISVFKAVADEIGDIVADDKANWRLFEKYTFE